MFAGKPCREVFGQQLDVFVSVAKLPPTGKVYNLALGDREAAAKGLSTLIAEGIVVGDADMQQYFTLEAGRRGFSRSDVITRLDKAWHRAYLNSLRR